MPEITSRFRRDEQGDQSEDSLGESLSHPEYRALVIREARRSSGTPDSRTMYTAQRKVDASLGKRGASVEIPGALPGRRTV